jgi:hypothetical protein
MGKIDPNQLVIKVRAVTAEVQQIVKRSRTELDGSRRLLATAVGQRDRAKVQQHIAKAVTSARRLAFFTALVEDLTRLRDNAPSLASQAAADRAREKAVPTDFVPSLARICCAADFLHMQGLCDIKAKFIAAMYGRPPTDALSQRASLEPADAQALYEERPTEEEIHEAFVKFATENPALAEALEPLCGFPVRQEAGLLCAPPLSRAPPAARATWAPGARAPPPANVYLPLDLPPFSRDSWAPLVEQVRRAVL